MENLHLEKRVRMANKELKDLAQAHGLSLPVFDLVEIGPSGEVEFSFSDVVFEIKPVYDFFVAVPGVLDKHGFSLSGEAEPSVKVVTTYTVKAESRLVSE